MDGKICGSWVQSLSGKGKLATIHRQDSFLKIPEQRGESEASLSTTKSEKNSMRRVRGVFSLWPQPPTKVSSVLHWGDPLGLKFLLWEKGSARGHEASPAFQILPRSDTEQGTVELLDTKLFCAPHFFDDNQYPSSASMTFLEFQQADSGSC